jgi:hypothetical protein
MTWRLKIESRTGRTSESTERYCPGSFYQRVFINVSYAISMPTTIIIFPVTGFGGE